MSNRCNPQIIRFWAIFDLIITGILAIPFTAELFIQLLYTINGLLGSNGSPPAFDAIHWLFVCFTGGLGVLWAIARISQPTSLLSKIDATGRLWMTALLIYFIFLRQAPLALLLFVVSELIGALHQLWSLRRMAGESKATR